MNLRDVYRLIMNKEQGLDKANRLMVSKAQVLEMLKDAKDYRFSPLPTSVDEKMSDLLGDFVQAGEGERKVFLSSLDEQASYALLAFAERMSMLSVRRMSESHLRLGSVALVLAIHHIDPRMGLMIISLLYRSAERMGVSPDPLFRSALDYAIDPAVSDLILSFLARDPKRKDIRAMGFKEVEGPSGLIYWQGGARPIPEGLK
jgi:hypothetical protein